MRIEFIGLRTKIVTVEDKSAFNILFDALKENEVELVNKDVLIIASKIISTIEGCRIKLSDVVDIR